MTQRSTSSAKDGAVTSVVWLRLCCALRISGLRPQSHRGARCKGMTLLEIMTVITILAAMMVVVFPRMVNMHNKNKMRAAARELVALMKYARTEAVFGERTTEIFLDTGKNEFWLDLREPETNEKGRGRSTKAKKRQLEQKRQLGDKIFIENVQTVEDNVIKDKIVAIDFFADGSASPTMLTLGYTKNDSKMTIEVIKLDWSDRDHSRHHRGETDHPAGARRGDAAERALADAGTGADPMTGVARLLFTRLHRGRCMGRCRAARAGFVLLEVVVSLTILGIAVAALMRSFTISMHAIRKNDVTTQACMLAEGLLQSMEVSPPKEKVSRGTFEDVGFPKFSYEMEFKEEEIRYKRLKTKPKNLKPLRWVSLRIVYDNGQQKAFSPVQLELYLPPIEHFEFDSKFLNELFYDEMDD